MLYLVLNTPLDAPLFECSSREMAWNITYKTHCYMLLGSLYTILCSLVTLAYTITCKSIAQQCHPLTMNRVGFGYMTFQGNGDT